MVGMSFVVLDDKTECPGYYSKGELFFDGGFPEDMTRTWKYLPFLEKSKAEYASLYCSGKSLDEVCPEELQPRWEALTKKMQAFIRSFQKAKININDVCFYDLVSEQFLLEFFDAKCKIIDHVFENYEKPADYDFRLELSKMLGEIEHRPVQYDPSVLKPFITKANTRTFLKKIEKMSNRIAYNQFGSRTGRLTTKSGTFPILTTSKEHRGILKPLNGYYLELDFNAAELRTLLALSGKEQPSNDIHQWNKEQVGSGTREEVKQNFFAWLYGSKQVDGAVFDRLYETEKVKQKYWNGYSITNPFGRKIDAGEHHALNYIIQSTAADISLRQAVKVHNFLKDSDSHIAAIIHDALIIDLSFEDRGKILEMASIFSDTDMGIFKTSVKVGKNLLNMKEIK